MSDRAIVVYGAYGHTGRFVVSELRKRERKAILSGRNDTKLKIVSKDHPGTEVRVASVDDPRSLDRALSGSAAVINCAGPFLDTAGPVIEAALRACIPYFDVSAKQASVLPVFERFAERARDAEVVVVPAIAFYGGLADLLATAALGNWSHADEISIATKPIFRRIQFPTRLLPVAAAVTRVARRENLS
jgi:short subunit dehydrogenase-like uncharacterized protein